jgi:hypothetical protein
MLCTISCSAHRLEPNQDNAINNATINAISNAISNSIDDANRQSDKPTRSAGEIAFMAKGSKATSGGMTMSRALPR